MSRISHDESVLTYVNLPQLIDVKWASLLKLISDLKDNVIIVALYASATNQQSMRNSLPARLGQDFKRFDVLILRKYVIFRNQKTRLGKIDDNSSASI